MKIKLGVITTEIHMEYFNIIEKELENICDIKFFIINNLNDVKSIYIKNVSLVDGFILSGPYIYEAIDKQYIDKNKPLSVLLDNETVLYKQILHLIINQPDIDISRIHIDFMDITDSFLGLKKYFFQEDRYMSNIDIVEKTNIMLKKNITLWKEKKIDLLVTAFGQFIPELEKNGVRYIFTRPTLEHIRSTFREIINEIEIIKLNDQKTVIGTISIKSKNQEKNILPYEQLNILKHSINKFFFNHNLISTVNIMDNYIIIVTNYKNFIYLTSSIENCSLLDYLVGKLDECIKIGWGSGKEFYQASENSINANKQAEVYKGSCSFFIDENQKVIGPLRRESIIKFNENVDSEIIKLAKRIDINNINLQKIMYYAKRTGTNKLSSKDIADCLGITVRGANRILNKIEEKGYANVTFEKRENTKGRPKKYYKLTFLNKTGNNILN